MKRLRCTKDDTFLTSDKAVYRQHINERKFARSVAILECAFPKQPGLNNHHSVRAGGAPTADEPHPSPPAGRIMANVGNVEIIIIAAVVLLVFGGAWIPRLARRTGRVVKRTEPARAQAAAAQVAVGNVDRKITSATRVLRMLTGGRF